MTIEKSKILPILELYTCIQSEGSRCGTPTIADASYTKIGRMVFCGLQWTTDGTSDGSEAQINGFPFTSANLTTAGTMGGGLVTQTTGNAAQDGT